MSAQIKTFEDVITSIISKRLKQKTGGGLELLVYFAGM
jgi:hypothetical protein